MSEEKKLTREEFVAQAKAKAEKFRGRASNMDVNTSELVSNLWEIAAFQAEIFDGFQAPLVSHQLITPQDGNVKLLSGDDAAPETEKPKKARKKRGARKGMLSRLKGE